MPERLPASRKRKELAGDRLAWEKQPWEAPQAFAAFALYRDLGFARSLARAAAAWRESHPEGARGGAGEETTRRQMAEYSSRNLWVERCDAYDRHVDERLREQREGRIGRMNRRHEGAAAILSGKILRRASLEAGERGEGGELPLDVNELDVEAAARTLLNLQRVERVATGQATELVGSAFNLPAADARRIFSDLVQLALRYIPEERQPLYASEVQAYATTGSLAA